MSALKIYERSSPRSRPGSSNTCPTVRVRTLRKVRCASAESSNQNEAIKLNFEDQTTNPGLKSSNTKYNWSFSQSDKESPRDDGRLIMDLPLAAIRRPLGRTRGNDQEKVLALMESIKEIGLQEPIDVLDIDGVYYGFSGCHRFEAHQRLGVETIRCRVRKATKAVLKMHLM